MLPQDFSKNQRIEIWKWDGLFWHSFFSMFGLRDREGSNNFLHTTTNLHNPYLVAEWIHFTLFGDNMTHYKTESVHFLGLMNSATKYTFL